MKEKTNYVVCSPCEQDPGTAHDLNKHSPDGLQKLKDIDVCWHDVTVEEWNDWRWQVKNRIHTLEQLSRSFSLDTRMLPAYKNLTEEYHFSITPYYLSLINHEDQNDPIWMQTVPILDEIHYNLPGGTYDPLGENKDMPVAGLVHRYPDRCLAIITNRCDTYCRHCTRKRLWRAGEQERSKSELKLMADYVAERREIREVIISGGDPLTLSTEKLDWFLGLLRAIPHVEVLRIGSRSPVVLPMRITSALCNMLRKHRPLWFNTQFNHPTEVTSEAKRACEMLLEAGIPVSNQSVLLKGINDSYQTMKTLLHKLQAIAVMPYYLFQCDLAKGTDHFRTSIWTGIDIIEKLRGHTSGLCIPQYVIDAPDGGGKIPLQPFYLLSASEKEVTLRNYEGKIFKYPNPGNLD